MNTPSWSETVKYDGSRKDIIQHFNNHHYHNLFQYIWNKTTWENNTDEEIKRIMINIGKKNKELGFESFRKNNPRNLSYEDGGHLINTVLIYNKAVKKIKDETTMNIVENNCTRELPEYLKTITEKEIESLLGTETSKETYKFLHKKIRNILHFFYNFVEEYEKEQAERNLEDNDKENIYSPKKETAFDKTYKEIFRAIDPHGKFIKENQELCRVFFSLIKRQEKSFLESKSPQIKIESWEMKTKNLQENTNPDFEDVDEDGDVIWLTWEHTKGWNIPNPPRLNDPFG